MKIFEFHNTKSLELTEIRDYLHSNLGSEGVRWWFDQGRRYDKDGNTYYLLFTDVTPEEESILTMFLLRWK